VTPNERRAIAEHRGAEKAASISVELVVNSSFGGKRQRSLGVAAKAKTIKHKSQTLNPKVLFLNPKIL
jgi:hypothetical protein